MTRFVDSIIAYRILRMLVTPFEETDAYRLGIIDKHGKELLSMKDLNSSDERDAYTILHRMIFRIKKIIEKVPVENKKLASFAAALALIKEHYHDQKEPIDLEYKFLDKLQVNLTEEYEQIEEFNNKMLSFRLFVEEGGMSVGAGAPINNASATPGVAGFTPETVPVKAKPKVWRRKKINV